MSLPVDLYWSFRSPYSYLALPRIMAITRDYEVDFRLKIVFPIALRQKDFFKKQGPEWVNYTITDVLRVAQMLEIPIGFPRPDPILMDLNSGEITEDQPYIYPLVRMGIAATEQGKGLQFVYEVSQMIWSGEIDGWDKGDHMKNAAARAGLDFDALAAQSENDAERLDAIAWANADAQKAAGHWGVPLFVFNKEPFFGQDRIEALIWRLKQFGLRERH